MGINGIVMEQFALPVKADHFAPGSETRVDGKDVLSAEWRRKQKLSQVFDKYPNSLGIRPLLGCKADLSLHGSRQKSFVAVMNSGSHLVRCRTASLYEQRFEQAECLIFGRQYAEDKEPLVFSPAHGHDPG